MTTLAELIAAFRADKLKLPALFDALGARGPVPEEDYRREVALLEQLCDDEDFNPLVARALIAKLRTLHGEAADDAGTSGSAAPGAGGDAPVGDANRVQTAPPPSAPPGVDADDVTVVKPATRPPAPVDDATVVQPASRPAPGDAEITQVQPASRPFAPAGGAGGDTQGTAGTGSSSSSLNASTWQRMAGEAGGEYATVGMLLKGRFLLEREIGRGGMGVVYLARDERKVEARDRDPYVAVKVLNDEFRRHPDSLIALQREARRSQQLAHDNIVRVYDFDKDGTIVFMTMEYVDGSDLKTLIRERAFDGLPLAQARPLIEGMAWALKRAHTAGVVHSDFKPGNVMVTRAGAPKVFDFGIARAGKHFGGAAGEETVFDAGTLGALTPAYASLEMIRGAEPTPADDIYALGCVTFELLTGKHPFDKASAEVALKEGRRPPPVPGLTRRQYKALCDAVAFHSEQRLQSTVDLVEGLRDVSLRERAGPYLAYGAVAAVALAAGGWGVAHYLHRHHVAQVVARFSMADPHHYATEDQAFKALYGLDEDERGRIVLNRGDAIQDYLLARVDAYWNPDKGRYDYAGVQHVLQLRDRLKLYSPKLDVKRSAVEQQRNDLLNSLDTQLTQRIDAGAIFEDQPDNAVQTLATIRAIDPGSDLLKNAELELKYDIAIGQSLGAGHLDEAKQRLALATKLFPASARLQARAAQLQAALAAAAPVRHVAPVAQSVPEARTALAALIARPDGTPEWQARVDDAMRVLRGDDAPQTHRLVDALAGAIAAKAATESAPLQLAQASAMVAAGLKYAPKSAPLLAQQVRLANLQQQQQDRLAQESAAAEVGSRIESMKRAAAAHDIAKAQESLARIRTLQPDNPFLAKQGPQLLADAYLGQARDLSERGKYRGAADTLERGLQALGNRVELRNARDRQAFVADLMQARGKPLVAADIQRLRSRLAALGKADASGLSALQDDLKLHGALPSGGTLSDLLDALKPAAAAPAPSATLSVPAGTPTPGAAPPGAAKPGATEAARTKAGAAPAAGTASAAAAGPDPCARAGLAGSGRACFDSVGSARGPALVVVPGVGGGPAYAMSRTEITVAEFNRYCSATKQCATKSGDRDSLALPVSNISLAQAKGYAAWLGQATGRSYRLPSDAEWLHAAQAGGNWTQSPDSNCILPSASADDSGGGPISARGREPNPWGLVNLTGNVWEWTVGGGGTAVRGGSYNSYWSDCTVASHRGDSGQAQKDVGFRVLRELQ